MLRAISISVNARNRCTAEVTRLTQNHNRCCGLATSVRPCGIEITRPGQRLRYTAKVEAAPSPHIASRHETNLFNRPLPRRRRRPRLSPNLVNPRTRGTTRTIDEPAQLAAKKMQVIDSGSFDYVIIFQSK